MSRRTHGRAEDDGASRRLGDLATALLRQHGRQIRGWLRAVLRDRDAAADAYGAFEEDLWRGLPAFRGECSRKTWAFRLAWHAAVRTLRDPWRRHAVPLGPGAGMEEPEEAGPRSDGAASPDEAEVRSRAVDALRAGLRPEERRLLALRVDERLTWEEVGALLARPGESPAPSPALRKRFERLTAKLARQARATGLVAPPTPAAGRRLAAPRSRTGRVTNIDPRTP